MAVVKSICAAGFVGCVVSIEAIIGSVASRAGEIDQWRVEQAGEPKAPGAPYAYKRVRTTTIQYKRARNNHLETVGDGATGFAGTAPKIDQKHVESAGGPKAPGAPYVYKPVRTTTIRTPLVDNTTAFAGTASKAMVLKGQCLSLVLLGENVTSNCSNTVIRTSWDDGRTGFYFTMEAAAKLAFGGKGVAEIKPDANAARRPIDFVLFAVGKELHKSKAVGHCVFTNPYIVPATIECHAEAGGGKFDAKFKTDRAPE